MLICSVFEGDYGQCEIRADDAGLGLLARAASAGDEIVCDDDPEASGKRQLTNGTWRTVSTLRFSVDAATPMHVSYSAGETALVVSGAPQFLGVFAENVQGFQAAPPGEHQHVEWFEGHFYLQEGSLPVVLVRLED